MATAELASPAVDLAAVNASLASAPAEDRIAWTAGEFAGALVLSSSFGAQAAVMLSLATRVVPGIPVVFVDTGYLFPETYRFADELTAKLDLYISIGDTHTSRPLTAGLTPGQTRFFGLKRECGLHEEPGGTGI